VIGTTDYVSPEQALGRPVTGQSDLYSLGVVLYEMLTGELPYKAESQVAVAMKHVREAMPDVRALRPEVSAALAAVIERATARELDLRYADDGELIADLEAALAIETSRAGSAEGEVTAVLETLPPQTRRRVPFSVRHRGLSRAMAALISLLVAAGIVVAVVLGGKADRGHRGKHGGTAGTTSAVQLCASLSCTNAYNPYGKGPGNRVLQNNSSAKYVVDGDLKTYWATDQYYGGNLDGKPGVGIYVSGQSAVAARRMVVYTSTTGFNAKILATNTTPNAYHFGESHWVPVGGASDFSSVQRLALNTGGKTYRYYLLWITSLPTHSNAIFIQEIKLSR
jgi:serine/threonine-protein kinase